MKTCLKGFNKGCENMEDAEENNASTMLSCQRACTHGCKQALYQGTDGVKRCYLFNTSPCVLKTLEEATMSIVMDCEGGVIGRTNNDLASRAPGPPSEDDIEEPSKYGLVFWLSIALMALGFIMIILGFFI